MLASRREVGHPSYQLRKPNIGYFDHDRIAPALEEIVVLTRSKLLSCNALVSLVRKLQLTHVTWDRATVLPYPLHEASFIPSVCWIGIVRKILEFLH
jgi:hypothetical protein